MPFKVKDLVFSIKVEETNKNKVALKLKWRDETDQEQALEKIVDCGRTSTDPVRAYVEGDQALTDLKGALNSMLEKLKELES